MSEPTETISWNRPMLERFKVSYREAVDNNAEVFAFDGHDFFTGYAKHLIEHLEKELP